MFFNCPACSFMMAEITVNIPGKSHTAYLCSICGSVWISGNCINDILAMSSLPMELNAVDSFKMVSETVKEGERTCPECYSQLQVINKENISVDFCQVCKGIMFDRHELQTIWSAQRGRLLGVSRPKTADNSDQKKKAPITRKTITVKDVIDVKKSDSQTGFASSDFEVRKTVDTKASQEKNITSSPVKSQPPYGQSRQTPDKPPAQVSQAPKTDKTDRWDDFENWFNEQLDREKSVRRDDGSLSVSGIFRDILFGGR